MVIDSESESEAEEEREVKDADEDEVPAPVVIDLEDDTGKKEEPQIEGRRMTRAQSRALEKV